VPQLVTSLGTFTHAPEHIVCPVPHWQLPAMQVEPPEQTVPHVPQFWLSVPTTTHAPPQSV
jgi:hypothetical protein